jgi:hypothetical protein
MPPQSTVPVMVPALHAVVVVELELLLEEDLLDDTDEEDDDLLDELDEVAVEELDEVVVPAYEHQVELLGALGKLLRVQATLLVNVP